MMISDVVNTNYPFLGLVNTFILIFGLYYLGENFCKIKFINSFFDDLQDIRYQYFFVSINFLLIFVYNLLLFTKNQYYLLFISLIIYFFGIVKIVYFFLKKKLIINSLLVHKKNYLKLLTISILILLFLISIAPVTNSDSLGYHMTVAKIIMQDGIYPSDYTHFHQRLAGSGEVLISVGLIFGAEQFSSVIQFLGLVSLAGIFLKNKNDNFIFLFLLILTSPIILTLVSSAKPQLFAICSSSIIFYIFSKKIIKQKEFKNNYFSILFGLIIVAINTQLKFSFVVNSFVLSLIIFYFSFKTKNLNKFFINSLTVFILIILPPVFWKHINFGGNFFQYFVSPLPIHVSAMGDFHNYLQAVGSSRPVIEWLIPSKMGDYTNTLGFCVIIFFYFFLNFNKFLKAKLPLFCIFLLISTIFMFGQKSPRFFLDSIIWLLLLFEIINLKLDLNKYFKLIFASQILILSLAMIFSVFSLTSGTLSKNLKDQVLKKNADGYTLFKWSNSKLKKDESIISYHRSIYFSEVNTMAVDLLRYIPDIKRARENGDFSDEIYWQEFQSKKPKYLLTYGEDPYLEGIENCIGDLVHYKKDVGAHATRNPINRSNNYYNGYLFEFNYQELPACAFNE